MTPSARNSAFLRCIGGACPLQGRCYRFLAPKQEREKTFRLVPYGLDAPNKCNFFVDMDEAKGELQSAD